MPRPITKIELVSLLDEALTRHNRTQDLLPPENRSEKVEMVGRDDNKLWIYRNAKTDFRVTVSIEKVKP